MRHFIAALICALSCISCFAMNKDERKEFLDAIRPEASRQAGQPVRFKVSSLNQDGEWAVLVGSLLPEEGKSMDWSKAEDCDPSLDKLLWVVARKEQQAWKVKEMYICSPEPPYWNLDPKKDFSRPCGIYAGLEISGSETAEQRCRAYQSKKRR
jgi:hypothetical protein